LSKVVHPLSRLRSGLAGTLVLFLSAFALTACIVTADQSVERNPKDPRAQDIAEKINNLDIQPRQVADSGASGIRQQSPSRPAIYLSDGGDSEWAERLRAQLDRIRAADLTFPTTVDARAIVREMRLVKDADEIALLRRAAEISARAHVLAMRAAGPGRYEFEVQAALVEIREWTREVRIFGSYAATGEH